MPWAEIVPELMLAIGGMALLLLGTFTRAQSGNAARKAAGTVAGAVTGIAEPAKLLDAAMVLRLAVAILATAGVGQFLGLRSGPATFGDVLVLDGFAAYVKGLVLISSAIVLVISQDYLRRHELLSTEYSVLFLFATLGMSIMVSATNLMSLYMGLELQSLSLYVLASFRRDASRSTEAGLKYFVLGALSSGMLLYGASLVYGYTGTTRFDAIAEAIVAQGTGTGMLFGLAFLAAGIAFKVSAVPFHMWTPDVYEGAPSPVTAFFASAPKVAAAALFARLLHEPFAAAVDSWQQILIFLAVASMFVGAVAAIGQANIKRLMAYSSIGHMGYALVGLAAGTKAGLVSLLVYLTIYLTMNLGTFAFIVTMARSGVTKVRIADLSGLSRAQPVAALCLAVLMFSLAGIPPLVGFFAKFFVFKAAVDAGLTPLAVAGAIASVIAAYYYLNIVRVMYIDDGSGRLDAGLKLEHRLVMIFAALVMAFGWLPFLNGLGIVPASEVAAAALLR